MKTDLCLVNPRNFYTYIDNRTGKKSCLDLCFCSRNLADAVTIKLGDDVGSDHCTVEVQMACVPKKSEVEHKKRWIITKDTLINFGKAIEESTIMMPNTTHKIASDIRERIIEAAKKSFKQTTGKNCNKKMTSWWTAECHIAVMERRRARKLVERHPTQVNIENYRKKSNDAKNICKKNKKRAWNQFVSELSYDTPTAEVWKKFKQIKNRYEHNNTPLEVNDTMITDIKTKADLFVEYFKEIGNIKNYEEIENFEELLNTNIEQGTDEDYNKDITEEELIIAINTAKETSPGICKITNKMIRALPEHTRNEILRLMNQSYKTGTIPEYWKRGLIVPIPKPEKDKTKLESYRPITLLSCVGKTMERIVQRRLQFVLEMRCNAMKEFQCGFRKGYSTMDILLRLDHEIKNALKENEICVTVYIDLKSAFDKIWRKGVIYKLIMIGIQGNMLKWLESYLQDRFCSVEIGNILSEEVKFDTGVPQGAILSPILFNLMMTDLPTDEDIKIYCYADDITLTCTKKNLQEIVLSIEKYLNELSKWSRKWGIEVNPSKTKMQYFTRRCIAHPMIRFENAVLRYERTKKLLGLILDSPKLTWNEHVNHVRADCLRRMNILKSLYSTNWGANAVIMKKFYMAYIRSKIGYGIDVYGSSMQFKKLEVVQNSCLRLILGARNTSPVLSLQAEASIPSLDIFRKITMVKTLLKILYRPENDETARVLNIDTSHTSSISRHPVNSFARLNKQFLMTLDVTMIKRTHTRQMMQIPPWVNIQKFIIQEPDQEDIYCNNVFQDYIRREYVDYRFLYTDGSKIIDKSATSSGIYIEHSETAVAYKLNGKHSIVSAELFAIFKALQYIKEKEIEENCIVFTDSRTALQILANQESAYRNIKEEIQQILIELNLEKVVKLHWIKAHAGIRGNEIADRTAKLGHEANKSVKYDLAQEDLYNDIKKRIKNWIHENWIVNINHTGTGKFLRDIKSDFNQKNPIHLRDRRSAVVMHRLRIGHAGTLQYLHRFDRAETESCSQCNCPETIDHYLLECKRYEQQRNVMKRKMTELDITELTLKMLLGGMEKNVRINKKIIEITVQYIKDTNRIDSL